MALSEETKGEGGLGVLRDSVDRYLNLGQTENAQKAAGHLKTAKEKYHEEVKQLVLYNSTKQQQ